MNEYRKWLIEKGYCVNCGKEKAFYNRTMCPECLDKVKESSERTRTKKSKEQRKRYIKRKRELCIAFGVCRECLCKKATVGLKCIECHAKEIKRRNRKRTSVNRKLRINLGLCYFCGLPAISGKKTCPKCYEIQSSKLKLWHLNYRDNSNHHWRRMQAREIENSKAKYVRYINRIDNLKKEFKV